MSLGEMSSLLGEKLMQAGEVHDGFNAACQAGPITSTSLLSGSST